jgi:hypothetical protein
MLRTVALAVFGLALGVAVVLVLRPKENAGASSQNPGVQSTNPSGYDTNPAKTRDCINCDFRTP